MHKSFPLLKILICTILAGSLLSLLFFGCKSVDPKRNSGSLKEAYSAYFKIGTTISPEIRRNKKIAEFILFHFNTVSFENFSFKNIHPEEGTYRFDDIEHMIEFTNQNKLEFRPSPLIDAESKSLPPWFTRRCSPMVLRMRSMDHIFTVTTHFRHSASKWIIVRGALAKPRSPDVYGKEKILYKKSKGQRYVFDSFSEAQKNRYIKTKLYSDFDLCNPSKREKAIQLIKSLKRNGTPINGIVIESNNWTTTSPSLSEIEETITTFYNLGIEVHFSELAIEGKNIKATSKRYGEIFKLFRDQHHAIQSISIGGNNCSELFGENLRPNSNFNAIIDF